MGTFLLVVTWLLVVAVIYVVVLRSARLGVIRGRLREEHRAAFDPQIEAVPDEKMPWLRRWLFLAGHRRPEAPQAFLFLALGTAALGFLLALGLRQSSWLASALRDLDELPSGVGAIVAPLLVTGPWILFVIIASVPWLKVRADRRRRVREVEEDLPLTLQILATLARAGLGFDAALVRVLESGEGVRVLPDELHTFRGELLSGVPRVHAWRRLARRMEVPATSIFVSAMVHAEQIGGGLAGVLEHQAEDVQSRRREHSLVKAQALPVKLVFPLVLCFLPGIFVWTMGPAFYQFLQVIDGVMRGAGSAL